MSAEQGMTLAICTRNRHDDLERCVRSIAGQRSRMPLEVLIVDDGSLPEKRRERLSTVLTHPNWQFSYYRKNQPGLLYSRLEALKRAKYELVLFLDDDVELEEGYVERLAEAFERFPDAAGIGGRDVRIKNSFVWSLFCKVFLYSGSRPGKLSLSGYGGSMTRWGVTKQPFRTEYMLGCNMAFRRAALHRLRPTAWLNGYSLGEDLYLSQCAMQYGNLWIDPELKVAHHQSPVSRDKEELVAYTEIVNHYYLLQERDSKLWRYACLLWTSCGLLLRAALKKELRFRKGGYWKALKFVAADKGRRRDREGVVDYGHDQPYR